ncbi:MAG: beta-propeller domain-containing protein [Pseudomonadota bacterium]
MSMSCNRIRMWNLALATLGCALVSGCPGYLGLDLDGDGQPDGVLVAEDPGADPGVAGVPNFTSANPDYRSGSHMMDAGSVASDSGSMSWEAGTAIPVDASTVAPGDPGTTLSTREILEADIVQIRDGRLYALSEYRGLLVVDVSVRDALAMLGRYRTQGTPFEMYLVGDVAFVIYSSFWTWVEDPVSGQDRWQRTSRIVALDIADPAAIHPLGEFDLAGEISDSRLVGNILYAVSYEDATCYLCTDQPRTVITSLAVGDVDNIQIVDQLAFNSDGYGYGPRSVTVTTQRMYVAGEEWGQGAAQSTIQVVDISNMGGTLQLGAQVEAAGQIFSRWQMNEYQGVLRVISQPGGWGGGGDPVVQTFRVQASDQVSALARMTLQLPRPEQLMSVQFDGPRAYAVTFERTDPLFLIDLSDPVQPLQRGELEIPGWLYHMVPAGDRLYALGYDQAWGALAVSLFDVGDLDAPRMLSRVAFGGDWGAMPEDQDRIHKAFKVMPELGLITMPFAGWSYSNGYRYLSGIQLIDIVGDSLVQRAVAPHQGQARRAILHDDRLLALSDERLEVFDISDRGAPQSTASLTLARTVYVAAEVQGVIAELVSDWWTGEGRLDFLSASDPDGVALSSLDLSALRPQDEDPYDYWTYSFPYWSTQLLRQGSTLWLVWSQYSYQTGTNRLSLASVDVTDPSSPVLGSRHSLDVNMGWGWWSSTALVHGGSQVVLVGDTLVVHTEAEGYHDGTRWVGQSAGLAVVDLREAATPRLLASLYPTPGGDLGGLQVHGDEVWTVHQQVLDLDPGRVALYLDRLDLSDPERPSLLAPVNIPGVLLGRDPTTGQVLTLDLQASRRAANDWTHCAQLAAGRRFEFLYDLAQCEIYRQRLHVIELDAGQARVLDRIEVPQGYLNLAMVDAARMVAEVSAWYGWYTEDRGPTLQVFAPDADGDWALRSSTTLPGWYPQLQRTSEQRVVLTDSSPPSVSVLDISDAATPVLRSRRTLPGYAYQSALVGELLLTTCGPWGVAVTPLDGSLPY